MIDSHRLKDLSRDYKSKYPEIVSKLKPKCPLSKIANKLYSRESIEEDELDYLLNYIVRPLFKSVKEVRAAIWCLGALRGNDFQVKRVERLLSEQMSLGAHLGNTMAFWFRYLAILLVYSLVTDRYLPPLLNSWLRTAILKGPIYLQYLVFHYYLAAFDPRVQIVQALSELRSIESLEMFCRTYRTAQEPLRKELLKSIAIISPKITEKHIGIISPGDAQKLLEAASKNDVWIRLSIARAMKYIGSSSCVLTLVGLSENDPDQAIREAAGESLKAIMARGEQERATKSLMRSSTEPVATTLLRPAGDTQTDQALLLRSQNQDKHE